MKRRRTTMLLAAVTMALQLAGPVHAVLPDEILQDERLEARARALSQELRCLVCRNQSIDDSASGLARDLRLLLRERLMAGDDDQQALDYMAARYGSYILLRPPVAQSTLLLWLGPGIVLVGAMAVLAAYLRARPQPVGSAPVPLSDEEESALRLLTGETSR